MLKSKEPGVGTPGIAQRQGITPADLLRMLDSGMRISDFLTAMGTFTNADHTAHCDLS
jgi:hypothetical protein